MAKDTLRWTSLVFILNFVIKSSSPQPQPSLTEYLLATLGPQGIPVPSQSIPPSPRLNYQPSYQPGYQPSYGPSYQNYQTPPAYSNQPNSAPSSSLPTPLTAIANLAASIPVPDSKSPKTPTVPKSDIPSTALDSNVLNNLAIALQLLIVSNILNTPPAVNSPPKFDFSKFESASQFETVPISPLSLSYPLKSSALQSIPYLESPVRNLYSYQSVSPPNSKFLSPPNSKFLSPPTSNSKFLGSSGYVEPSMFGSALTSVNPRPSPRSSVTLMSPYEALEPNSPFSDPGLSSLYGNSYCKKDFQSPYASILAAEGHKDLFSVSDLF